MNASVCTTMIFSVLMILGCIFHELCKYVHAREHVYVSEGSFLF